MKLSACVEMLFAPEHPDDFPARIHAAKRAGFDAVEFWYWKAKDIEAVKAALDETGLSLTFFLVEKGPPLVDRAGHPEFMANLEEALDTAKRLGAESVVAMIGAADESASRREQREAIVDALGPAAAAAGASGVKLLIEPLNSVKDHPGVYLTSLSDAFSIAASVDSPHLGIIYDIYHSAMMGEDTKAAISGQPIDLIKLVHVADMPGRNQPGTGEIDFADRLGALRAAGWAGPIGYEFRPTTTTDEALTVTRRVLMNC